MSESKLCPFCMASLEAETEKCPSCGHSLKNTNPRGMLPCGTVVADRYTIGEFISADGEGIVYHAVENKGPFRVTIKEYLPVTIAAERAQDGSLGAKEGSEVLFKTTRMDFADLYHALQCITPATGLEAVLDVVERNDTVYAVMESPCGEPLSQVLEKRKTVFTAAEAAAMLKPVFEGVAAMHQAGLVHRGICPENICVLENGRARLTGYATIGLRTMGSGLRAQLYEGYSAPEQYSSAEFEGRYTDVYALSALVYRMVCGQTPLSAGQRMMADSGPSAHSVEHAVPKRISDVLLAGLALKPSERIQTVPELMEALASPEAAGAYLRRRSAANDAGGEKKQQHNIAGMLAAVLVLLAVLILLTIWGILNRSPGTSAASSQPEPTASATPAGAVPDFKGLLYTQVQSNREYSGKYLFYITEEYNADKPVGTIIEQEPAAGEPVTDEAQIIRIVVSKGPEMVAMPNIIGFTQEGAIGELESRGLVPSCLMVANDGSNASGCVVSASVQEGVLLQTGSVVTVYIAADRDVMITATPSPAPTATPEPVATLEPSPTGSPAGEQPPDGAM